MVGQLARIRRAGRAAALAVLIGIAITPAAVISQPDHDGSHDFDWEIGSWKTHLRVLRHRADGAPEWLVYDGITIVRPIWGCRANMVELEVDGPEGHMQALNLRLYDPRSRQWSLNFASTRGGGMSTPTVGGFRDGVGEFYDQEAMEGRSVLVRNVWSGVSESSGHMEQSISDDGGKTWAANWIADDTRIPGDTNPCRADPGKR